MTIPQEEAAVRLPPFCFRLPAVFSPPPVRSVPRSIVCRPPARPPFRHTDHSERKPSAPADHPAPFSLPDPPRGKTSARPHSISILPADPIPAERLPKKLRTYRIRTNLLVRSSPHTKHTARTAVSAADSPHPKIAGPARRIEGKALRKKDRPTGCPHPQTHDAPCRSFPPDRRPPRRKAPEEKVEAYFGILQKRLIFVPIRRYGDCLRKRFEGPKTGAA